ncbi:hypothetical protein DERP_008254 [Dermatophagoides pteronyssinus]|uniref:Uncharacterized protein n=1 Tax=Dermatophagoides pteronyssinus TaxID=6956 RepID=A0ABQ8J6L3_DERPT|nr:hypothetical protein DERP_008254 [Dermatophagoides pteronyssinus]
MKRSHRISITLFCVNFIWQPFFIIENFKMKKKLYITSAFCCYYNRMIKFSSNPMNELNLFDSNIVSVNKKKEKKLHSFQVVITTRTKVHNKGYMFSKKTKQQQK